MLSFHAHLKVFVATAPCDLRASFNGLWAAAQVSLGGSKPATGEHFKIGQSESLFKKTRKSPINPQISLYFLTTCPRRLGMRYTYDLTDAEWQFIHYCFPKPAQTGRPRQHTYRELLHAMFSVVRTACPWRNRPKDFAPWRTVSHYFRLWKRNKLWERIHPPLREHLRQVPGRKRHATAGIIDRQSVQSTACSDERGYDAGKKVNGRKRHVRVDTLGLVLRVRLLPAHLQDRAGARQLLAKFFGQKSRPPVNHIGADGGYAGAWVGWALQLWRCTVEMVKRTEARAFKILPRRWGGARSAGWAGSIGTTNAKPRPTKPYRRLASAIFQNKSKAALKKLHLSILLALAVSLACATTDADAVCISNRTGHAIEQFARMGRSRFCDHRQARRDRR